MPSEFEPSVLIVEDEPCIRDVLAELFEGSGIVVESAGTVEQAVTLLAARCYSLILTDVRLGGQRDGGLRVMASAGLLSPQARIIALTAFPDDDTRAASRRLGASHYMEKPVPLERIAELAAAAGVPTAMSVGARVN